MKKNLERKHYYRGYENLEQINDHFERLIKIFQNIHDNGYKTQKQLKIENSGLKTSELDEIFIFIGRNGNIIGGNGGHHRMTITKLLGLKKIPVLVIGIHQNWAKKCFNKYNIDVLSAINKGLDDLKYIHN